MMGAGDRMEEWKNGRLEDWKIGRLEDWKIGMMALPVFQSCSIPSFHHSIIPSALSRRSPVPALPIPRDDSLDHRDRSAREGAEQRLTLVRGGMLRITDVAGLAAVGHGPAAGRGLETVPRFL